MRLYRALALGATLLVLVSACSSGGGSSKPTIKIGSDGFYESKLDGRDLRPGSRGQRLHRRPRPASAIGARKVVGSRPSRAARSTSSPSTSAAAWRYYEPGKQTGDPKANQTELQNVLNGKGGGITVLDYTPAADQNAFVVRTDTAAQFHLTKMSDLTAVQAQLKFGVATDCPTNPVCGAALKTAYGLDLSKATLLSACDTPMAQALLGKTIDVGELCSTQPDIAVNGWVLLQDDKQTQPADNIAPLVRNDYLAKVDKTSFEKLLNDVSAKMDTATLTDLGKQVSVDKKDIAAVAKAWLQTNGFVK